MWLMRLDVPRSPRDVALRLSREPGLAWLDGGLTHGREGRYSFVSAAPCEVRSAAASAPEPLAIVGTLTAAADREAYPESDGAIAPADVPHWVGHVAYDAGLPAGLGLRSERPSACARFARYDAFWAFDHLTQQAFLLGDDAAACERLRRRIEQPIAQPEALAFEAGPRDVTPRAQHEQAVRAALALIYEGELYEINLARRYRAAFAGSALGLFLRMRDESPVPLGYFVDAGTHALLGRSMERFLRFRVADRMLSTAPIKGTLARAGDDRGEAERLRADPKEHAEHAMVVDLMRNDLSRVCEVGSVEVRELMAVLPFAGLSHLVSTVEGRVRSGLGLDALLAHTFPPGSVTGTPKKRVLRAIAELEGVPRGVYTGCMGFVDRAGGCSLAVAIRTAVVEEGDVTYFAGGGIVADSDPAREVDETDLKAQMFLRALSRG